jgi:hypothetical protein
MKQEVDLEHVEQSAILPSDKAPYDALTLEFVDKMRHSSKRTRKFQMVSCGSLARCG